MSYFLPWCIADHHASSINKTTRYEDCPCPQPCNQTVYEPSLSYALLSTLSEDQILSRQDFNLEGKYEVALETVQRVNPEIFTEDIRMLMALDHAYKEMNRHVAEFLDENTDNAIAIKLLLTVAEIRTITVRDCSSILQEMREFKKSFETKFSANIDLLKLYNGNLDISYREVKQILELSSRQSGVLISDYLEEMATDARMWTALTRATIDVLDNDMVKADLNTQNGQTLPAQYFTDHTKDQCVEAFAQVKSSLDTLMNVYANVDTQPHLTAIRDLDYSMGQYNDQYEKTNTCIHEYSSILDDIVKWLDENSVKKVNTSNDADRKKQEDAITQFADNKMDLEKDWNLVKTNLLKYSKNQTEKLDFLKAITEAAENEATTLLSKIEVFTSRVQSETVEPLKKMITEAKKQLEGVYKEALNYAVDIDSYMRKNYFYQKVTDMNIWKLPAPNLEEPHNPYYFRETLELWKIWDQNMPLNEFVRVSISVFLFFKLKLTDCQI